ncbi:MAG: ATP-dependent sacrificial sulfur transferase LarE [Pirellulales bacterium]
MTAATANAPLPASLAAKRDRLLETLRGYQRCLVALSAGVDSAVVAQAACQALGDRALAVTATSASLAEGELDAAIALAQQIGIRHQVVHTDEFADPDYVRNDTDRCYHCKTELYTELAPLAAGENAIVVNGANLDDQGDYRPGMLAASEQRVRSPLVECELTKAEVRQLAAHWGLPVWDKPATPCLSSRVAYGQQVTPERVAMIDKAEQHLRGLGLRTLRVRYHAGDLARLEVPLEELPRLCEPAIREALVRRLRELGFRFITLDLEGFRSGSLNTLVPVEKLLRSTPTA